MAAFLPSKGIFLTQVAVESKENELTAAPKVLDSLDLFSRVVSGDALFTQRDLPVQILACGIHYLWPVKGN